AKTSRRVDLVCFHAERTFREVHPEETTQESVETERCSSVRSIQLAAHISNQTWRIRVRRLDTCANCWSQLRRDVGAVCPPERRRGSSCLRSAEWAQYWAQRKRED